MITAYSYSKLSLRFPSRGGTVEFINRAFGNGIFTGSINILLYLSYIIMISLYAYAFGSYSATFFGNSQIWKHLFISLSILIFTTINLIGIKAVGESEEYIVAVKIAILLLFIFVGIWSIKLGNFSSHVSPFNLIAGGMIIFLAYEGFELIANTAEDVKNLKILPKAYYTSVIFVIALYVLIAIVSIGNLQVNQIINARDYALAEAAKPFMGNFGFILIAIAAILSTSSAINATLYSSARISYTIAKYGGLPRIFERRIWRKPFEGVIITAILTLLISNLFDLSSISAIGSSGFLLIFGIVNLANYKLHRETKANRVTPIFGAILSFVAFGILIYRVISIDITSLFTFIIIFFSSFGIEMVYRKITGRKIEKSFNTNR